MNRCRIPTGRSGPPKLHPGVPGLQHTCAASGAKQRDGASAPSSPTLPRRFRVRSRGPVSAAATSDLCVDGDLPDTTVRLSAWSTDTAAKCLAGSLGRDVQTTWHFDTRGHTINASGTRLASTHHTTRVDIQTLTFQIHTRTMHAMLRSFRIAAGCIACTKRRKSHSDTPFGIPESS